MDISDLKRWHWIVISVFVGLLLAYTRSSMEPPRGPRSTKAPQFEAELVRPPLKTGESFVKNLTIYPPINSIYPVEFDLLTPTKDNKAWTYTPWYMDAETPYPAVIDAPADLRPGGKPYTILDHLNRLAKTHPSVKYSFAWWATPKWVYIIWTSSAVILIGGIWPTILNVLVGAGFGPGKSEEKDYDLERFGKYKTPEEQPVVKSKEATEDDRAKLAELQAKLEANLGGFGVNSEPQAGGGTAVAAPVIKKLDGKAEEAAAIKKQEEEDKEYKGEFYPVARTGAQKDEQTK